MLLGLWVGLIFYVDAKLEHRLLKRLNGPIKVVFGTLHFQLHIMALLFVGAITTVLTSLVESCDRLISRILKTPVTRVS